MTTQPQQPDFAEQPWLNEPDELYYTDPDTGYSCAIRRHQMGHLCGYVLIPAGHILDGKDMQYPLPFPFSFIRNRKVEDVGIMGAMAYSGLITDNTVPAGLYIRCHEGVTFAGNLPFSSGWWLGFDCAHSDDLSPIDLDIWPGKTYRTIEFVKQKLALMCSDIKSLERIQP